MRADLVTHVQPNGHFIEWVDRKTVHEQKLAHRSSSVLVFHPDGRLLIQLRHRDKTVFPHYWDVSCSGHVEYIDHPNGDPHAAHAAFWSAATREIEEELGIAPELHEIGEYGPVEGVHYEYTLLFYAISEGPFHLQEEEVEAIQWVTLEELESLDSVTPQLRWMAEVVVPKVRELQE